MRSAPPLQLLSPVLYENRASQTEKIQRLGKKADKDRRDSSWIGEGSIRRF